MTITSIGGHAYTAYAKDGWVHYRSTSPLARLIRWLRGGPYADVMFA